jgi:hypothetical protein
MAISVTCKDFDAACDYNLRIDAVDSETYAIAGLYYHGSNAADDEDFVPAPPNPIIQQDYTNGRHEESNLVKYYFFPIDYGEHGLPTVLLNKTKMSG